MPAYLHASISLDHADDLIPSAESQMSGQSELLVRCCLRTKVLGSDQAGRVRRHSPKPAWGISDLNNPQDAVVEHCRTDVLKQRERIFLLPLVLAHSMTWGGFPSLLQAGCFPGALVPPWLGRARGQLQGRLGSTASSSARCRLHTSLPPLCICGEPRRKARSSLPGNKQNRSALQL